MDCLLKCGWSERHRCIQPTQWFAEHLVFQILNLFDRTPRSRKSPYAFSFLRDVILWKSTAQKWRKQRITLFGKAGLSDSKTVFINCLSLMAVFTIPRIYGELKWLLLQDRSRTDWRRWKWRSGDHEWRRPWVFVFVGIWRGPNDSKWVERGRGASKLQMVKSAMLWSKLSFILNVVRTHRSGQNWNFSFKKWSLREKGKERTGWEAGQLEEKHWGKNSPWIVSAFSP